MPSECRVQDNVLQCSFPADPANVEHVMDKLKSIPSLVEKDKIFFDLCLVLREALNNAIVHGACNDITKTIECLVTIDPGSINIVVISPGQGFEWEKRLTKDLSDSPAQSGWGIFLIQEYTDHLSFKDSGKRLECRINMDRYQGKDAKFSSLGGRSQIWGAKNET
ncbi:ATP-binding protein [Desulfonatronospira sp.]|uniref:ATP-binding protein n=1 Tax=Desulfonatronospira sp. TaxID=1962951 RepID=UPI0025C682C8|nr:ATP-binding protein [Desulfonatronospira sp.]